jgi:hypothetical protein
MREDAAIKKVRHGLPAKAQVHLSLFTAAVPVVRTVLADSEVDALPFGLACQGFWQAIEDNPAGNLAFER